MRLALGRCGLTGAGATLLLGVRGRDTEEGEAIQREAKTGSVTGKREKKGA